MSIESVTAELGILRARIDARSANVHTWPTKEEEHAADLDRYDRRLLRAPAMAGIEAPTPRGRDGSVLDDQERGGLEVRLARAGLDVQTGRSPLAT